jgi:hypothetical protein
MENDPINLKVIESPSTGAGTKSSHADTLDEIV